MSRTPLIAGNWKMNGLSADASSLAQGIVELSADGAGGAELLVCPPATAIAGVADIVNDTPVALGGQDCHTAEKGAHTGDISAAMLRDLGCSYVIVGHSERRTNHGETDALVCEKAAAASGTGLIPIICVGETEAQRDANETIQVVIDQVVNSCPKGLDGGSVVIAYEPVWAIGTGRTPTSPEVQEVHATIREALEGHLGADAANNIRILYGGSMKPENAKELLALADVDGGLIGGASLKAEDFWAIAQSCA